MGVPGGRRYFGCRGILGVARQNGGQRSGAAKGDVSSALRTRRVARHRRRPRSESAQRARLLWRARRAVARARPIPRRAPLLAPPQKTMNASPIRDTDVLIVGAGPTGLVLALWLTHMGVRVRIVDKTAEPGTTSRALAVQARTLEFYN